MRLSDWSATSYQTLHSRAPVVRRIRGTIPTLQPGNEDVHRQSVPDIDIRGTCAGRSAVHAIQQQARINLGINYHCEFGQQVCPSMMRALLAKKHLCEVSAELSNHKWASWDLLNVALLHHGYFHVLSSVWYLHRSTDIATRRLWLWAHQRGWEIGRLIMGW